MPLHDSGCAQDFLARHATPWPADETRLWSLADRLQARYCALQFHLRSFAVDVSLGSWLKNTSGLVLKRQHATLSFLQSRKNVALSERRYSIALNCAPAEAEPFGWFAIVCLADFARERSEFPKSTFLERCAKKWKGIHVCREFTGIAMFQHVLCTTISSWADDWERTLSRLDDFLRVKVCQPLSLSPTRPLYTG